MRFPESGLSSDTSYWEKSCIYSSAKYWSRSCWLLPWDSPALLTLIGAAVLQGASQLGSHEKVMAKNNLQKVISLLGANEIKFQRQPEMERPRVEERESSSIFSIRRALDSLSHLVFMAISEVSIIVSTLQMCVLKLWAGKWLVSGAGDGFESVLLWLQMCVFPLRYVTSHIW